MQDGDHKENGVKPKVRIIMNYGLVTKITSEGSEISVEIIEEDTDLEERFTKINRGARYALSPGESSAGIVAEQ